MSNVFVDAVTTGPLLLGILAAAVAGLVSFASPCVIPLVPGYLSYLTSLVGGEVEFDEKYGVTVGQKNRRAVVAAASLFVLGFTVVFLLATVSALGAISALQLKSDLLMRIGGVVTILMGVVFMGWVPALQREARISPRNWSSWVGAPLLGGVFALGWTPCLGPTLASIISVAAGTEGMTAVRGALLIVGYCIGLGLPFLLLALGSAKAMDSVEFLRRHSRAVQIIGGVAMVVVGLLLVTGIWNNFINLTRQWAVSYEGTLI